MNNEEIRTVKLLVNNEDASKKIDSLKTKLEQLRVGQKKALESGDPKALKEYGKEINKAERQLQQMQSRAVQVDKVLSNLDGSSLKDMKNTVKELTRELNSGKIERGSKEWDVLTEAIRKTKQEIEKVKEEQDAAMSLKDRLLDFGNKWMGIATTIGGAVQAISGIKTTIRQAVQDFADMEEAEAQVIKYTGLTKQEVRELNDELKRMDTRTARERLNALAGDAGRLGIQSKREILEFVDAADKINVALGEDLGGDAVKNIGKLTQLFGEDKRRGLREGMLATGSAINELAQHSSASEPYILEFTGRVAGAANQAHIAQANVMGLAATLDKNMVSAEKGATALQKVIVKMYQDPAKIARAAGLDVEHFTKLLKEDANAALLEFLQSLSNMGSLDQLAPLFGDMQMSGAAIVQVLSTLSANIDDVRDQQELATRAFADATSVTHEFNVQNNTVQAGLDKAKKRFHDVSVELGEKLRPVASHLLSMTSVFLRGLNITIEYLFAHKKALLQLTIVLGAYTVAVMLDTAWQKRHAVAKAASIALDKAEVLWTNAKTVALGLLRAAYFLMTGQIKLLRAEMTALNAATAVNPWGLLLMSLAAVGVVIYNLLTRTKELTREQRQAAQLNKDIRDIERQKNEAVAEEVSKVKVLTSVIHDNTRSLSDRLTAVEQLKKIIPDYNVEMNKEGTVVRENTKAVKDYIQELKNLAMAQAVKDKLGKLASVELDAQDSLARRQSALYKRRNRLSVLRANYTDFSDIYDHRSRTGAGSPTVTAFGYEAGTTEREALSKLAKQRGVDFWELKKQYNSFVEDNRRLSVDIEEAQGWVSEKQKDLEGIGKRQDQVLKLAEKVGVKFDDVVNAGTNKTVTPDPAPTVTPSSSNGDPYESERKRMESAADEMRISLQSQYSLRLIDYRQYTEQMAQLDVDLYTRQRDLYAQNSEKWLELNKKVLDAQQKLQQNQTIWSLNQLDVETEEERKALFSRYAHGEMDEESYRQQLNEITIKYLKEKADLLRRDGTPEEAHRAELEYQKESEKQRQQSEETFLKKYNEMKKKYLKLSAAEREKEEINLLEQLHAKKLINEEEFQKVLHQIRSKYKGEGEKEQETLGKQTLDNIGFKTVDTPSSTGEGISSGFTQLAAAAYNMKAASDAYAKLKELRQSDLISQAEYNAATTELDRQRFSNFQAMAQAAYATVSSLMSSYSQFAQACADAEVAKVTARYDKEIEAAGQNSVRGKKLEEKKQKEINKIKKREAKKQATIQIAQALAATAMNAIQAYGCMLALGIPAGPVLAPIAAAAAVAAGMLQVATIKKQAEAQSAEYYTGGFTGGKNYRRKAGIVHEGEFVANHEAVNNPNVLPVLRLIDHAQRNNTIGSLTAADVSRAIITPGSVADGVATAMQPVMASVPMSGGSTAQTDVLDRLSRRLDEPIVAYVAMDEFDRQQRHYERLKKRK